MRWDISLEIFSRFLQFQILVCFWLWLTVPVATDVLFFISVFVDVVFIQVIFFGLKRTLRHLTL